MKRFVKILLLALIALSLICGCADTGRSSDKKSKSTESSTDDDDEDEDDNSSSKKKKKSKKDKDNEEDEEEESTSKKKKKSGKSDGTPLYERICGSYCYDYGNGEEETQTYTLDVFSFGANLYAYGGDSMDSSDADLIEPYSFWALEFIPDNEEDLLSTEADECSFQMLTFSIMSNLGMYWNEPDQIKIKVTNEGLEIKGLPYISAGTDSPALFKKNDHIEPAFTYMNTKPVSEKMDKDLIGIWQETDSEVPFYVEFSENNNIKIYQKHPHIEVTYSGGSFSETEDGHLECTLSYLGNGSQPSECTIDYSIDGDEMTLSFDEIYDVTEDSAIHNEEMTFKKIDVEDIPVITKDDLKGIKITNIYEE
ncbi:MAG: hypothetical protein K5888_07455 [Lachnospiraceae bacterium]|nr:hypothetical protein [Lachnospiraceae bacterium]